MKQIAEEFINSLRGKVNEEGETVLDLLEVLIDAEYDKRNRKAEKQAKEMEIDTPFSEYKVVEAFGTKMVVPTYANYVAVDSGGLVYVYPRTPLLVEGDEDEFAFLGAGALYIGKVKNREVFESKEPCELCVELKELDE